MLIRKLYRKSEILFTIILIIIYITGNSCMDQLSRKAGMDMILTLPFDAVLLLLLLIFIRIENRSEYYGLCRPSEPVRKCLYYIPLLIVGTVNIWFGICFRQPFVEGLVYFVSMLVIGALEELIFRGFLYQAMAKRNVASAIILTSILFGMGHIVNLINGSGMPTLENICQLFYAFAVGFLFVSVLYCGKSILPCMAAHALFNSLSLFANEEMSARYQIPICIALCVISLISGAIILKSAPGKREAACSHGANVR